MNKITTFCLTAIFTLLCSSGCKAQNVPFNPDVFVLQLQNYWINEDRVNLENLIKNAEEAYPDEVEVRIAAVGLEKVYSDPDNIISSIEAATSSIYTAYTDGESHKFFLYYTKWELWVDDMRIKSNLDNYKDHLISLSEIEESERWDHAFDDSYQLKNFRNPYFNLAEAYSYFRYTKIERLKVIGDAIISKAIEMRIQNGAIPVTMDEVIDQLVSEEIFSRDEIERIQRVFKVVLLQQGEDVIMIYQRGEGSIWLGTVVLVKSSSQELNDEIYRTKEIPDYTWNVPCRGIDKIGDWMIMFVD